MVLTKARLLLTLGTLAVGGPSTWIVTHSDYSASKPTNLENSSLLDSPPHVSASAAEDRPAVQRAFFQSQSGPVGFGDLPVLPAGNSASLSDNVGGMPTLPPNSYGGSPSGNGSTSGNSAGLTLPPEATLPPAFRNTPPGVPTSPPPNASPMPTYGGTNAGAPRSNVVPNNSEYGDLPSQRRTPAQAIAYQREQNELRQIQDNKTAALRNIENQNAGNVRAPRALDPRTVATGLPFVTPPPGRYATSPYNQAVFHNAVYQRSAPSGVMPARQQFGPSNGTASQVVASQLVTAPANQAPANGSLVAASPGSVARMTSQPVGQAVNGQLASATLPQYANPGIYPTAYQQCDPAGPSFPSTGAVPGTFVPPTYTPNLTPGIYTPNNSGYAPLFSLGQENYNVQLGRGIIGQPTVYVQGQPVRNFMRYLSP